MSFCLPENALGHCRRVFVTELKQPHRHIVHAQVKEVPMGDIANDGSKKGAGGSDGGTMPVAETKIDSDLRQNRISHRSEVESRLQK